VYFDGSFRRYADVHLGLMTYGLQYGTGCFEGIRGYWTADAGAGTGGSAAGGAGPGGSMHLLQPAAHYDRLHDSARILLLDLQATTAELVDVTIELIQRNGYTSDCYIRPILFKSQEGFGFAYTDAAESFGIFTTPFGRYLGGGGVRCKVSSWRRVPDSAIPVRAKVTGSYINSVLAKSEAQQAGFDEAIVLDGDGHVSEGSAENIFMVRDSTFITPPVSSDILEGITRRMLMELVTNELGLPVVERAIDRTELYICDELLLCGTGAEVTPVINVDGRSVGSGVVGPLTGALCRLFDRIVHAAEPKYAHWLVAVPSV